MSVVNFNKSKEHACEFPRQIYIPLFTHFSRMTLDIYLAKKLNLEKEPLARIESGIIRFENMQVARKGMCIFRCNSKDGEKWTKPKNIGIGVIPYTLTIHYTAEQRVVFKNGSEQHPLKDGQNNYLSPIGDGLILLQYNLY